MSNDHQLEVAEADARTGQILIALGDCAVFGGICTMRNFFDTEEVLRMGYIETASTDAEGIDPSIARTGQAL